jgi:hypothetical protein
VALLGLIAGCSSSASDATPDFVGTWARTGTVTTMCAGQAATDNPITGNLVIALGTGADSLVTTDSVNSCMTTYTVSGRVASAMPGQMCMSTNARGGQNTLTNQSHRLTLSDDGKTITEAGMGSVVVVPAGGGASVTCTSTSHGTFTKQ